MRWLPLLRLLLWLLLRLRWLLELHFGLQHLRHHELLR
jgi:hypothetical protein